MDNKREDVFLVAIAGAVLGALKASLKNAAKKVAMETGTTILSGGTKAQAAQAAKAALDGVAKKTMTDAQAVLMNRLKTSPSKIMYDFVSNEIGVPVNELKKVIKYFNQTPKMKEISKGQQFRDAVYTKVKKDLGKELSINSIEKTVSGYKRKADSIKDIMRKIEEKNAQNEKRSKPKENINKSVLNRLIEFQEEFDRKLHGILGTSVNQFKSTLEFDLNFIDMFDSEANYTQDTKELLDVAINNLVLDAERYDAGSGGDLFITQSDKTKWKSYTFASTEEWVKIHEKRIGTILDRTQEKR